MGRATPVQSRQPLRRSAPPPHEWGGQLPSYPVGPSGAPRHLPMNGEDSSRPIPPPPHEWGGQLPSYQPLRRFAPPPHEWGGQLPSYRVSPQAPAASRSSWL